MAFANPTGSGNKKPRPTQRQLLTAGGIVLAGLVGILAAFAIFGGSASPAPAATLGSSGTSSNGLATSAAPPPSVPQPDPSVILHEGTLTLAQDNGVDLDSTAPNWDEQSPATTYADDLELAINGTQLHDPTDGTNFVQVDPSAPVAYATCAAATGYVDAFNGPSGQSPGQVNTSLRFCVRTTQGRFALVQVTSAPIDPNGSNGGLANVTVNVTTWARSASAS